MPLSPTTPIDPRVEMFQRGQCNDAFFNMKALAPRPQSEVTTFDTDFEDDDDSIIDDSSPRLSVNSNDRRSETTLSSFEEAQTPSPNSNEFYGFFDQRAKKSVEGPRGPHLFRASVDSYIEVESDDDVQYNLTMSPMTPRPSGFQRAGPDALRVPEIPPKHRHQSLRDDVGDLKLHELALWNPRQVARWMSNAGIEPSIAEKFEENDISGAILITLKFEDLRELDIPSFGQRTKVWNEIQVVRGSVPATPKPPTPFEEDNISSPCIETQPPTEFKRQLSTSTSRRDRSQGFGSGDKPADGKPRRHNSSRRRHKKQHDVITPLESVSIVGIEQLMPKPHKCAKGENCSKWRKQQRLIENFKKDHPVSPEGGSIWIAGDPGNPFTAPAVAEAVRPVSDAVPSVVASSDVLGPGPAPAFRHLEEASLRTLQSRDPQENVKHFIQFQHMDSAPSLYSSEEPPSPPYEMFPALQPPKTTQAHVGLRGLPRLAIPPPRPITQNPPPRSASANAFSPYRMERAEPLVPELRAAAQTPSTAVYRFGTPFSEMDIPVTAIPLGPVQRDFSQSVPPNMAYRQAPVPAAAPVAPARTQSRASTRRPSVPVLPRVDENVSTAPPTQTEFHAHHVQPPAGAHPWSPVNEPSQRTADDISHAGWMKKRKTKMLRHEWHEHHFTLKGTRLAMHKDDRSVETLEYIDIDDYAIACSSVASNSKLNAAFKAMTISRGEKSKKDESAFAFQLIPQTMEKSARIKKRESAMVANEPSEGKDAGAKNKTHFFAVKNRDERIDWMRELMLAKALKQKSDGYQVNVNGNMI